MSSTQAAASGNPLQNPGKAPRGNVSRLPDEQIRTYLLQLPAWKREGEQIVRVCKFKNYYETIAFVNAVAWIANREDHHPDLMVTYNACEIRYSTHSVGGLSMNDVISAFAVEGLLED